MDRQHHSHGAFDSHNHANAYLHEALKTQIGELGNMKYAYFATPHHRGAEPAIVSNYPARWLKSYRQEKCHLIDPIINHGLQHFTPFSWSQALASSTEQGRDFFRRATRQRLCCGVTFTLRDAAGMFSSLSLCDEGNQIDFDRRLSKLQSQLQMMLIQFHDRFSRSRTVDELFPEQSSGPLSARELDVLKLVVLGTGYREIADKCGISERTVKFHMSNISGKLQVGNAKQAVYEAQRQGIL